MLPVFPNFKIIELSNLIEIENYTKQFPPYNDFDFMSLWTYNTKGENSFSILNNNLIIRIQDFVTGDFFYSFIGQNNVRETIDELILRCEEENLDKKLKLIPEVNFENFDSQNLFNIKEDIDSFDYILSVDDISELSSNKYLKKRNMVNNFINTNPNHAVAKLDLKSEKTKQDIINLFLLWEKQKNKTREETIIEMTAIERLFDLVSVLDIRSIGIFNENKLVGFSTVHFAQNNFAILSFQKCDISYKGIYEYLMQSIAKDLKDLGCKYINYEQDLGIEGLRRAKQLWRPVFFLKKYTIQKLEEN